MSQKTRKINSRRRVRAATQKFDPRGTLIGFFFTLLGTVPFPSPVKVVLWCVGGLVLVYVAFAYFADTKKFARAWLAVVIVGAVYAALLYTPIRSELGPHPSPPATIAIPPRASVEQVWALALPPSGEWHMLMIVRIVNPGQPSIFQNFGVSARINGVTETGNLVDLVAPIRFRLGMTRRTILCRPAESLVQRAIAAPIPQGGNVVGLLAATFPPSIRHSVDPTSIKVTFQDASGATYDAGPINPKNYNLFAVSPGVCKAGE